jgi:hypothetical protein
MTSADQGAPSSRAASTGLPTIVGVHADRSHYGPPRLFVRRGADLQVSEAIEIVVQTSGPIPARALSPVLWVGAMPLPDSDRLDDHTYTFYGIEPDTLVDGAPLALGWSGGPPEVQSTLTYSRPQ